MSDDNAAVWARLRELEAGHNELSRQVVGHLSACDVRHQEIVRRQGESAQDRANLRAEMMSGFAGINAKFEAHNDSIANVERNGFRMWIAVAGAVVLITINIALAALPYIVRN